MDKFLRPDKFDADTSTSSSTKEWEHWKMTFRNFLAAQQPTPAAPAEGEGAAAKKLQQDCLWEITKFQLLVNHISPRVYAAISEHTTYSSAMDALDKLYIKPTNIIHARHVLTTRRQHADEKIDTYMQALKQLAKDCQFTSVDAETNKNESIRGAFIAGITSKKIRERLLENVTLTLEETYNKALTMEMAEENCLNFSTNPEVCSILKDPEDDATTTAAATSFPRRKCFFCGAPYPSDSFLLCIAVLLMTVGILIC